MNKKLITFLFLFVLSKTVYGLPLQVDYLISNSHNLKLNLNLQYANNNKHLYEEVYTVESVFGQDVIDKKLNERSINLDHLYPSLSVSYGILDRLESGVSLNYYYLKTRNYSFNNKKSELEYGFKGFNINLNGIAIKSHEYLPDLVLFTKVEALDKSEIFVPKYLASVQIGGTVNFINDPIVISNTVSYQLNFERKLKKDNSTYKLGNLITYTTSLNFVVNPQVTIESGIVIQSKEPDYIKNNMVSKRITDTDVYFGWYYKLTRNNTIYANMKTNVSSSNGSIFTVGLATRL